jgi:hypothetical protein
VVWEDGGGDRASYPIKYILLRQGVSILERRWRPMTVRIIIDRKVEKGKEVKFSDLLKELRSKAISSIRLCFGRDAPSIV